MSLLTICNDLALDAAMAETESVISSADREWVEAASYLNKVGDELARRVDFGALRGSTTLTGGNVQHDMPDDFSRITEGVGVTYQGNAVRPLTKQEWASLTPVEGSPRYFLLDGNKLTLWPYMRATDEVVVSYQSKNWCSNGTNKFAADDETSLIDEGLMLKGLLVRWRRQKGMDYQDYEAEYEADLAQIARFDDRSRL